MRAKDGLVTFAACAALAACVTAPPPAEDAGPDGPGAAEPAVEVTENDLFIIAIEAERYAYLIELAHQGAIEGPPAMVMEEEGLLERAVEAVHHGARQLYELRDLTCETGLVGSVDCGPLPPPDWFGEPVGATVSYEEVRRRIDWLTDAMGPFVSAGCDAGQSRQEYEFPYYCSVE